MEYSEVLGKKHIILTEDGVYEPRHTLRYKGTIDDQLQSYINQRAVKILDVSSVDGAYNIGLSQYSGGDSGGIVYYTSCRLKKLRINTTYEVIHSKDLSGVDDGIKWLSPTFRPNREDDERQGRQTFTLDWVVPGAMELYITFETPLSQPYQPHKSYLHCRISPRSFRREEMPDGAKGWFTMPTGNVYEDSSLCFGPRYARGASIMQATQKNIDLFYSTPWNADLHDGKRDNTVKMFRFDEENNSQLDPLGMPHELMSSFNNSILERTPIEEHPPV
jgi:hypothetical protein